jgi:eukaryotic-like serine/threonine-protein kinase
MNFFKSKKENYKFLLLDEEGNRHYLTKCIGGGGQGDVYRTEDKNVVVKFVSDEEGNPMVDDAGYDDYKSDIDEVRILNLDQQLPIAKPIFLLQRPYKGYVMRLLEGMVPIMKLMVVPKGDSQLQYYLETGGLKRRLKLLTKLSRIFAHLHSLPIVYADISPNNIFISEDVSANEVWLIDADNMRYTLDFNYTISTPGYSAPEVCKKSSANNTLSDVYSFARLAFELLTTVNPFRGKLEFQDSGIQDEDDWGDEPSFFDKIELGDIPFIDDAKNDSNTCEAGIPRDIVLTNGLSELFQRVFSLEGRKNPASRPTMLEFYKGLQKASDATVQCPECQSSYYITRKNCPFCSNETVRPLTYLAIGYDHYSIQTILDQEETDAKTREFYKNEKVDDEVMNDLVKQVTGIITLYDENDVYKIENRWFEDSLIQDHLYTAIEIRSQKRYKNFIIKNLLPQAIEIYDKDESKITLASGGQCESSMLDGLTFKYVLSPFKTKLVCLTRK